LATAADIGDTIVRAPEKWVGPVPAAEEWTRPYWEALRRHELSIQRCASCRAWQHPPVLLCPGCGRDRLTFEPVSGRGRLYSVTVCQREFGLQFGIPWIAAYVQLDEGPRLATNVVNCRAPDVQIGLPVSVVYQDYDDLDLTLALFEPVEGRIG
jgi:uncharacterized OB-fold protein